MWEIDENKVSRFLWTTMYTFDWMAAVCLLLAECKLYKIVKHPVSLFWLTHQLVACVESLEYMSGHIRNPHLLLMVHMDQSIRPEWEVPMIVSICHFHLCDADNSTEPALCIFTLMTLILMQVSLFCCLCYFYSIGYLWFLIQKNIPSRCVVKVEYSAPRKEVLSIQHILRDGCDATKYLTCYIIKMEWMPVQHVEFEHILPNCWKGNAAL